MMKHIYIFLVKYMTFKPLVKLSYIINGRTLGEPKWYQRKFDGNVRWKWLMTTAYELGKYVTFYNNK